MPLTRLVDSLKQQALWGLCLLLALMPAVGCGGGMKATFPKPRAAVDDDEESASAQAAAKPAPKPSTTAATSKASQPNAKASSTTAKTSQKSKSDSRPRTRATAIAVAADNAATAATEEETSERRPRTAPRDDDEQPAVVLPADLAAWTHDDFRIAKDSREPRLLQAISLLGRSGSDPEADARLLVELLDEPPSPGESTSARQIGLPQRALPLAIVKALAANASGAARNALKEILLGKLKTDLDDRTFTAAALAALVRRGDSEAEALVYTVLTMPEAVRPPGRSEYSAEALQKECLTLVRDSASPQLRLRLADYVAHPSTPAPHRSLLLPMLVEQRAVNLRAQTRLALDDFDARQRSTLARQLLTEARRSFVSLALAPDTPQTQSDDDAIRAVFAAIDPARLKEACGTAEELWRSDFIDRLAGRLGELDGPSEAPDLFALATSLPCEVLRPVVRKQLFDHWTDGEALVRTAEFTPGAMRDPGMLLVLKSLPRDDLQSRPWPAPRGNNPQMQRLAKERKAKAAWTSAVQTLTITLMRRCDIAGQVTELAAKRATAASAAQPAESVEDLDRLLYARKQSSSVSAATAEAPPDGTEAQSPLALQLPLDLPARATIESHFHLQWPEQLEGRVIAATGPLSIHYARLSLHDQGQRTVAFFARQLPGAKEHKLENGRWLDLASRPTAGSLRSIDVRVTRKKPVAETAPKNSRSAAEGLSVEILWIEISDFMDKTDGTPKS
jgi:hypothetical protein